MTLTVTASSPSIGITLSGCNVAWATVTLNGPQGSREFSLGSGSRVTYSGVAMGFDVTGGSIIGKCTLSGDAVSSEEAFMTTF